MITLGGLFGGFLLLPLRLGVGALLGLLSVRKEGKFRTTMACGNLVDLFALVVAYLVRLAFEPPTTGDGTISVYPVWMVVVFLGAALSMWLLTGSRLASWTATLLPVRGVHARRLLSALTLLGVLGPLPGSICPWCEHHFGTSTPLYAGVYLDILLCLVFYLAPLWDVMVRGWNPDGELR